MSTRTNYRTCGAANGTELAQRIIRDYEGNADHSALAHETARCSLLFLVESRHDFSLSDYLVHCTVLNDIDATGTHRSLRQLAEEKYF